MATALKSKTPPGLCPKGICYAALCGTKGDEKYSYNG